MLITMRDHDVHDLLYTFTYVFNQKTVGHNTVTVAGKLNCYYFSIDHTFTIII